MDIWETNFPVPFEAIDASGRVRLDALFDFFQEAATNHAEALGCGREAMAAEGQGWVLSRMSVLVRKRPRYPEPVSVRSWPRGSAKLFAVRDFDVRNAAGDQCVLARSHWLIIDLEKRRPLRPDTVMGKLPLNDGFDALASGAPGLAARDNLARVESVAARYTEIDGFGHVNNARYIEWLENSLIESEAVSGADFNSAENYRIDVNYIAEVKRGEKIDLFAARCEENGASIIAFEGRRGESAVFRAEVHGLGR